MDEVHKTTANTAEGGLFHEMPGNNRRLNRYARRKLKQVDQENVKNISAKEPTE